jgi:hypothetical protein
MLVLILRQPLQRNQIAHRALLRLSRIAMPISTETERDLGGLYLPHLYLC